jgi:transketolase
MNNLAELEALAVKIRQDVLEMVSRAKSSHIGSNYSMVELLTALYSYELRVDPKQPHSPDRDRFILSKGHACAALYAVLAERGFFPLEWLETFYLNGTILAGHATHKVPGVELSTGSLGHGLSVAVGMALAAKRDKKNYRVFTLLSDGECDEGSTWEAILFAPQYQLDNLIAIVDYNKIQSLGSVKEVLDPLADKWRSFNWAVREIDGHSFAEIERVLSELPFEIGKPNCIIAHTVKGKGIDFMENQLLWHYRTPQDDELMAAIEQLKAQ